jgi:hypothetical protein
MIQLLLLIFNWAIIIIGPNGLLLIVSHLFAFAILILWVGLDIYISM